MNKIFSDQLEAWLKGGGAKTILGLNKVFAEKSFAVIFLVLMFLPALPLPTGGISHIFEAIVMLLALEMVVGRRSIWLPNRFKNLEVPGILLTKGLPLMLKRIRWFEQFAKPRLSRYMQKTWFFRFTGLVMFLLTLAAFMAPPFSGLDTLPAFGVVVIALSLILEDMLIYLIGLSLGLLGSLVVIGLGTLVINFIQG